MLDGFKYMDYLRHNHEIITKYIDILTCDDVNLANIIIVHKCFIVGNVFFFWQTKDYNEIVYVVSSVEHLR